MIQDTGDTRYAFVNGIIRAREARLLTKGHFDRLIAGTLENFSTIISDTSYVAYDDIPTGLEREEGEIKNFLNAFCITQEVKNFVAWPEHMHNIKVRVKKGGEELLYPSEESVPDTWPEVTEVIERYVVEKDPFVLSTRLDLILCDRLSETARFAPFFEEYYKLFFDLENIRSFFRARQFGNSKEIFNQVFIPYGSMEKNKFLEVITVGMEHLGKYFFTTPYMALVEKGGAYLQEHHSFLRLERLIDETRLRFLKQARMIAFGVEPLFAYYHFKLSEIKKLRQVYWGKLNEVVIDELKESIPDVW